MMNFAVSIAKLWQAREELDVRNIRPSHMHYFLSLILSLTLADMQLSYFAVDIHILMLDSTTLMEVAYCIAAAVVLFMRAQDLKWYRRISTIVTVVGFVSWALLPWAGSKLFAIMICWAGLGGCAACSVYAYAFVLQNAERFYGAVFVILSQGIMLYLYHYNVSNVFIQKILPSVLVVAIVVCLGLFKTEDFPDISTMPAPIVPKGKYVILLCCAAFFTVSVFGELMLRTFNSNTYSLYALGIIVSVVFTIAMQFIFRKSVWHIWNLFLIVSVLAIAIMVFGKNEQILKAGAFLFGTASGSGYAVILYMGGGFVKRYGSIRLFKHAIFATCGVAILPMLVSGIVSEIYPQALSAVAIGLTVFFLFVFILFAPLFYQDLFKNEWMQEYHRLDMSHSADRFWKLGLTPREKMVCNLLLEGYTLRQISGSLKIGYPTVNTYCTSLYRKLSINSRAELFAFFDANTAIR